MKFTIGWLKEHLDTKFKDNKIIEKLTDVGLEVESYENINSVHGQLHLQQRVSLRFQWAGTKN